jgi:hypothetical protein
LLTVAYFEDEKSIQWFESLAKMRGPLSQSLSITSSALNAVPITG